MLKNAQLSETRTIVQPEIDLADGRGTHRERVLQMGWVVLLVIIAGAAAGVLGWVAPSEQSTSAIFIAAALALTTATASGWTAARGLAGIGSAASFSVALRGDGYGLAWGQLVAGAVLGLVAAACLSEALHTIQQMRADKAAYKAYLERRRASHLEALAQHAGQNIERKLSATEIDMGRFSGVLALIVYAKLMERATISDFTGPLLLQAESRHISLGSASKYTAELATLELERIGVLENNGDGRARTVRSEPLEDLIWRAVERWGRA